MCSMSDLCFTCSNDNECNEVDNKIVTQVDYLMPEITIIKLRIPLRICSICEKNLHLFTTFKKQCVENSLRFEAWIKQTKDNTDVREKCTISEKIINKFDEVCIREEVSHESENLEENYPITNEIFIKEEHEESLQENPSYREFDDLQEIVKEKSPPQTTGIHLHEDSSVDMDDESNQNSDDVVSDNSEINADENIIVTGSEDNKVYTCLICNKGFKQLPYLKKYHMKIHLGKKDFQCNECKKSFLLKSNLARHMKLHAGKKDFQCNECKKWFTRKLDLTRHTKQHFGVKDFQCKECEKCFSHKSNLTAHMKIHTGEKDYQCNECKKWFTRKPDLVRHMKQHFGIKDFQCMECEKCFSHKSNLFKHMKVHTREKYF